MSDLIAHEDANPFVSTGRLPEAGQVHDLLATAHARYKSNTDGENSQVYPALAEIAADLFGICVVGATGAVFEVGDTDYPFSIMSV